MAANSTQSIQITVKEKRKEKDTQKYTAQITVKEKDSNCTYKE